MNHQTHNTVNVQQPEQANPWLEGVKDLEDLGAENPNHPTRSALARAFLGVFRVLGAVFVGILKLAAGAGIVALAMAGGQRREDRNSHNPSHDRAYYWTEDNGWVRREQ